jgi:hypothetical protein
MSKIALQGDASGTGTFTIASPNSNTDRTLTLPDEAGTVLTSASDLTGVTGAGGLFTSYAVVRDEKGAAVDGGTFTSGADRTRDLNTEHFDPDGIVSLSSNQFTLQAGTYFIRWYAPAYAVARHVASLYNVTDSAIVEIGSSAYASASTTVSNGNAQVTIASAKAFEIRHQSQSTGSGNGFGVSTNNQASVSVYTVVEIFKEA